MLGRSRAAMGKVGNVTCPDEPQTRGSGLLFPDFSPGSRCSLTPLRFPCEIPWENIPDVPECQSRTQEFVTVPPFCSQDMKELFPLLLSQIQASRPWNEGWDLSPVTLVLWDYFLGNNSQLRTESRNSGRRIPTPAAASREGTGRSRKMG